MGQEQCEGEVTGNESGPQYCKLRGIVQTKGIKVKLENKGDGTNNGVYFRSQTVQIWLLRHNLVLLVLCVHMNEEECEEDFIPEKAFIL